MLWNLLFGNLLLLAPDGGTADGGGDGDNSNADAGDKTGDTKPPDNSGGGGKKEYSQAEIDAMIEKRLNRAKKDWQKDSDEASKKAAMTEAEKLKAEKDEADKKSAEAKANADKRVVKAEARVQAVDLGIKADRIDYALKLAELADVSVDDDGEPDSKAIRAAIEKVIKDLPELKGESGSGKGGGDFSKGSGGGVATEAQILEWQADPEKRKAHHKEILAFYSTTKK